MVCREISGNRYHHSEKYKPCSKHQTPNVLTLVDSRSKMIIIIIMKMGQDYTRGLWGVCNQWEWAWDKRVPGGEEGRSTLHVCV